MPSAPHPTYAMCMRPRRVTYTCECVPWNCCWRLEVIHWRKNFPERKKIFIPFIRYSLNLGKYYLPSINIYHFRHSYICIREGSHALKCNYIFLEVLYAPTHIFLHLQLWLCTYCHQAIGYTRRIQLGTFNALLKLTHLHPGIQQSASMSYKSPMIQTSIPPDVNHFYFLQVKTEWKGCECDVNFLHRFPL